MYLCAENEFEINYSKKNQRQIANARNCLFPRSVYQKGSKFELINQSIKRHRNPKEKPDLAVTHPAHLQINHIIRTTNPPSTNPNTLLKVLSLTASAAGL